jgi:hypothetical protein
MPKDRIFFDSCMQKYIGKQNFSSSSDGRLKIAQDF